MGHMFVMECVTDSICDAVVIQHGDNIVSLLGICAVVTYLSGFFFMHQLQMYDSLNLNNGPKYIMNVLMEKLTCIGWP